jgi:lysophospholipase L1-like esterase
MRAPTARSSPRPLSYVALGDSYTIGTGIKARHRWPNQLVRALRPDVSLDLEANLGLHGKTSTELISEQLPRLDGLDADFVTVLIGVNDVFGGGDAQTYQENVRTILDDLLARLPATRILVVSTPDYTLTPEGGKFGDAAAKRAEIERFNEILREETLARDISWVDISRVADRVPDDPTLVARDGLHPSSKQYSGWVEVIAPVARDLLAQDEPEE